MIPPYTALLCLALVGCSTYLPDREAAAQITRLPLSQQPAYINSLYTQKKISANARDGFLQAVTDAKEEEKLLAQMSPEKRAFYKLQKQQLLAQQEANRLQKHAIGNASLQSMMQSAQSTMQANNQILSDIANSYNNQTPVVQTAPLVTPLPVSTLPSSSLRPYSSTVGGYGRTY